MQKDIDYVAAELRRRSAQRNPGHQFDESSLREAGHFAPYFQTGIRVKVVRDYGAGQRYTRFGTVSVTTGWKPAFLLMHRSTDYGSSDVLGQYDRIVAVKENGRYREV